MTIEKKMLRSDIPGHHSLLAGAAHGDETARRLTVGRDIVLQGDIAACDHLLVEGVVEARNLSVRRLDLMESGILNGTAEVVDAVIAGRFEGNLTVTGRLSVKPTGRIFGEIRYAALEADAGCRIEAQVMTLQTIAELPVVHAPVQAIEAPSNVEPLFTDTAEAADNGEKTTDEKTIEKTMGETEGRYGVFRRAVGF